MLEMAFHKTGMMHVLLLLAVTVVGDKKAVLEVEKLKITADNGDVEMNYKILHALRRICNSMEHVMENDA